MLFTFAITEPIVALWSKPFGARRARDRRGRERERVAMMDDNDVLHLIDDEPQAAGAEGTRAWTIAVIDDDPAVHEGTRFALYD